MVYEVMRFLERIGPSLLQGWTWLMSVMCHVVSQVYSLLRLSAPSYWWLCLRMLPLHVWRCTAMLCQLTGRSWCAGGAFSLASSTAGKEHHGMEGVGGVSLVCTGEAGPSRTLAPRYPAKACSCSLHSFPLPISHNFTKGCWSTSCIKTDETQKVGVDWYC